MFHASILFWVHFCFKDLILNHYCHHKRLYPIWQQHTKLKSYEKLLIKFNGLLKKFQYMLIVEDIL
jgi:hypothetical protein